MFKTYEQCIQLLYNHINKNTKQWKFGNERLQYFLKLLDNPQNNFPVIHIAWTSWKWSTAYTTSKILEIHGYKVGLHISPHLLDIRERFQINNKLISQKKITKTINKMLQSISKCSNSFFGPPTYFEITLSLCYMIFKEEKIDIAILEAGCGWLFDGTNTANPNEKICIITKQWMDHEEILWNSIEEITFNDAGIIQKNNQVISLKHKLDTSRQIIEFYTKKNSWKLTFITKNKKYKIKKVDETWTIFSYLDHNKKRQKFRTNLLWRYQIENISLALKASEIFLTKHWKELNISKTKNTLNKLNRKWRFEIFQIKDKTVIIDGAHNPQKMKYFIKNLKEIFPKQKFSFIIAIKWNKKYEEILNPILPLAKKIIFTNFLIKQDFCLTAIWKNIYQNYFKTKKFQNRNYEASPKKSLKKILKTKDNKTIVITWSLYLLSFLYPILEKMKNK